MASSRREPEGELQVLMTQPLMLAALSGYALSDGEGCRRARGVEEVALPQGSPLSRREERRTMALTVPPTCWQRYCRMWRSTESPMNIMLVGVWEEGTPATASPGSPGSMLSTFSPSNTSRSCGSELSRSMLVWEPA